MILDSYKLKTKRMSRIHRICWSKFLLKSQRINLHRNWILKAEYMGYTHVFFLSIAGRISISRADPDISGEFTIVATFKRHRARLKHNSFQRICLVGDMNLVSFLSLSFASEGFALHQHTFDSAWSQLWHCLHKFKRFLSSWSNLRLESRQTALGNSKFDFSTWRTHAGTARYSRGLWPRNWEDSCWLRFDGWERSWHEQ